MMRWNDLLAGLEQAKLRYDRHGAANPEIHAITDDSRQVAPGSVFVAYKGVAVDGHRFIPDALRRVVALEMKAGKTMNDLVKFEKGQPKGTTVKLPDSVKNWVGENLATQVRDTVEEIVSGKPHGDLPH